MQYTNLKIKTSIIQKQIFTTFTKFKIKTDFLYIPPKSEVMGKNSALKRNVALKKFSAPFSLNV